MSRSSIILANSRRIATEERSRGDALEHYQHVAPVAVGAAPTYAAAYLRGESVNLNVDGSVTPQSFALAPAPDEILRVLRVRLVLGCATAPELAEFGDGAALANGLALALLDEDDAAIVDLLDGMPLRSNLDLAAVASAFEILSAPGSFAIRAVLDLPIPLRVDGAALESLRLTVSDNLTGLTYARCWVDAFDEAALR